MNILNINLPKSHFHTLIGLVKSGHTVYTNYHDSKHYEPSLGIKYITEEENNTLHFNEYKITPGEPCEILKQKRKEEKVNKKSSKKRRKSRTKGLWYVLNQYSKNKNF